MNEKSFNMNNLRKLLNEIDQANSEERGEYYLDALKIIEGGPKGMYTFFEIEAYNEDDRRIPLQVYWKNGVLASNSAYKKYSKVCPKTCKVFADNTVKIIEEIMNQGLAIDSVKTLLRGDVEFIIFEYPNGTKELRGAYYWSEGYEGLTL